MIVTVPDKTLPEITKLQLQQSIETYRVQMSLLVQICTVLVVADATTVGYAIQQKLAGIIWVGTVFPITMYLIIRVIFRLTLPVLATAIAIESKYKDPEVAGLMSNFVSISISPTFFPRLRAASLIEDESGRIKALQTLRRPAFSGVSPTKWMLIMIIVGQLLTPLLLQHFAHRRLLSPS
jgi:hypothetical protein